MNALQRVSESALGNDRPRRCYFLTYTIVFCCTAMLVFSWFIASGRTLIWKSDGWAQHYTALVWYGQYLRKIIRTLLSSHRLVLPGFSFAIGEGTDILTAMHYYVVGEPLNLLSVFFPTNKMYILYDGLIILRLYLAGASFSLLCFGTSQKNRVAILAGSLSYVFCFWTLLNAARHPYFLTPMIYFPMLILGVEKLSGGYTEKPYLFLLTVALAAASNFYFFYVQVLLTVGYFLLRAVDLYGSNIKTIITAGFRVMVPAVIGVLLAGLIFIPVVYVFLNDTRLSVDHVWYFLYPWAYYSKLPSVLISSVNTFWLCMGVTVPTVLGAVLLFVQKDRYRILRWLAVACIVIVLVPAFGQVLNGMSYRSNRWSFALSLLLCYILTVKWSDLMRISEKEGCILFCVLAAYWLSCMLMESSRSENTISSTCLAFAALAILLLRYRAFKCASLRECLMVLLVIVNIVTNAFWFYSEEGEAYAQQSVEVSRVQEEFMNSEAKALKDLVPEGYVRYSGSGLQHNKNVPYGVSSTNYFWSLTNPYIMCFRKELNLNDKYGFSYCGYDDRTSLLSLSATNYYLKKETDNRTIPYGYSKIGAVDVQYERTQRYLQELMEELGTDNQSDAQIQAIEERLRSVWEVYENTNSLPLGYCYDKYFTQEQWDNMSAVERQQAMLTAVYLSEDSNAGMESVPKETADSIPFTVVCNNRDITYEDGRIVTTAPNRKMTLEFNSPGNGETYVEVSGLNFDGTDTYDLYFGDADVDPQNLYGKTSWRMLTAKDRAAIRANHVKYVDPTSVKLSFETPSAQAVSLEYLTAEHPFYFDKHDYTLNLGYSEEPCTSVTITFPKPGVYSFDSLRVINVPMADFSEKIKVLQENVLENIVLDDDTVTGTVELDTPKILCVAIPYSKGWTAEVDGETVPIMVANGRYLGIDLPVGAHTVTLKYETPLKWAGAVSTVTGVLLLAGYLWVSARQKKRKLLSKGESGC